MTEDKSADCLLSFTINLSRKKTVTEQVFATIHDSFRDSFRDILLNICIRNCYLQTNSLL